MGTIMFNGKSIPIIDSVVRCKEKLYGLSRDEDAKGYSLYEFDKGDTRIRMHFSTAPETLMKLALSETNGLKILCSNGADAEEPLVDLAEIIKKAIQ